MSYNSDSGHHVTMGNHTGKVVMLHNMSKPCVKCELETKLFKTLQQNKQVCSWNYFGSSKGIEARGDALQSVLKLHKNNNVVLEYIVMDDDSTTESILSWNFEDALTAELITEAPKTRGGIQNQTRDIYQYPIPRL